MTSAPPSRRPRGRVMSSFAMILAVRVQSYFALRRSLGYAFNNSATILRALVRCVAAEDLDSPLTQDLAVSFILSWDGTANGRAIRHGVVRRFCDYLAIYGSRAKALDPRTFSRSRAIPPPRIAHLDDEELGSLLSAWRRVRQNLPLKLLVTPFPAGGLPGSISAIPIPCAAVQDNRAWETTPDHYRCAGGLVRRAR